MHLYRRQDNFKDLLDTVVFDPETTYLEDYPTTERTFAFVDLSGYTKLTQKYGVRAAAQILHKFRNAVRIVVGQHGVRVSTWLGDGVMLVSTKTTPLLEVVAELTTIFDDEEFFIHVGIAHGSVIIFEGNDYVGDPINIAARLAECARPSEILALNIQSKDLPNSMKMEKLTEPMQIRSLGELQGVCSLHVIDKS